MKKNFRFLLIFIFVGMIAQIISTRVFAVETAVVAVNGVVNTGQPINSNEDGLKTYDDTDSDTNIITKSLSKNRNILDVIVEKTDGIYAYNGGYQNWFDEDFNKEEGCGTVAAANITAYLALKNPSLRNLYNSDADITNITKDEFRSHMNYLKAYVKPGIIGIPNTYILAKGIEDYAQSRGVTLNAHDLFFDYRDHSFQSYVDYIKEGLKKDSPVALINWQNKKLENIDWTRSDESDKGNFQFHWVTITALTENSSTGEVTITVSSWGGTAELNFNDCYNSSGVLTGSMGVVYFDW